MKSRLNSQRTTGQGAHGCQIRNPEGSFWQRNWSLSQAKAILAVKAQTRAKAPTPPWSPLSLTTDPLIEFELRFRGNLFLPVQPGFGFKVPVGCLPRRLRHRSLGWLTDLDQNPPYGCPLGHERQQAHLAPAARALQRESLEQARQPHRQALPGRYSVTAWRSGLLSASTP